MPAVTSTSRSVLAYSTYLTVRIRVLSWWVVGTPPSYLLQSFLRFGSVATTGSVVSPASGFLTPARFGFRSSTRNVPTLMLPLAPTFVENYVTVILASALPPLSTQLPTPAPSPTLSRRPRRCLNPLFLLLNPLSPPPSCPSHRRLVAAVPPASHGLPHLSTTTSYRRSGYTSLHPRRSG